MEKFIKVYVEKAKDGTYWGTSQNAQGVVSAFGDSLEELKKNFETAYSDHIEVAKDLKEPWAKDYEQASFVYEMDLQGFFNLVPEINLSALSKKALVNRSLLQQYKNGQANASEEQLKKIEKAVHELGEELLSVSF